MSPEDFDLLRPHLGPVSLDLHDVVVQPDLPIDDVYFLEGGLASVVVEGEERKQSEVGLVGREGLIGIPILLGVDKTPHKVFMQVAGSAQRISVTDLRKILPRSPTLHTHLLRYVNEFMLQVAQTAYANARFHLDQRLARWMLMAQDRLGTDHVPLTHEFLALMLGVRRPGVTETIHILEGLKAIRNRRCEITILDRNKLQTIAGPAYDETSMASENGIAATSRPASSITS